MLLKFEREKRRPQRHMVLDEINLVGSCWSNFERNDTRQHQAETYTFADLSALVEGLPPSPLALSLLGMGGNFSVQVGSELVCWIVQQRRSSEAPPPRCNVGMNRQR